MSTRTGWTREDELVTEREELVAARNELEDEISDATYALGDATCRLAMTPWWRIRTRFRHMLDRRRSSRWLMGTHRAWHRNKAALARTYNDSQETN